MSRVIELRWGCNGFLVSSHVSAPSSNLSMSPMILSATARDSADSIRENNLRCALQKSAVPMPRFTEIPALLLIPCVGNTTLIALMLLRHASMLVSETVTMPKCRMTRACFPSSMIPASRSAALRRCDASRPNAVARKTAKYFVRSASESVTSRSVRNAPRIFLTAMGCPSTVRIVAGKYNTTN